MSKDKETLALAVASVFSNIKPVDVPEGEHGPQFAAGRDKALSVLKAESYQAGRRIEMFIHVAKIPTREAADAYINGYAAQVEAIAKVAGKDEQAQDIAARVGQEVSRMRRVARTVHGYTTKKDGKDKVVKGWGSEKVVALLLGKGTWQDKLSALPGNRDNTKSNLTPIQRRITAAKDVPATGSTEVLNKVLGISGEQISKPKQTENVLVASVKATPENLLMPVVKAIADRLLSSADEGMKDLGQSIRDAIKMEVAAPKPKRILRKQEQGAAPQPK